MGEFEERKSFIFYKSFYEGIKELSMKSGHAVFMAVCEYAFFGTEPENLKGIEFGFFSMIKPLLESNQKKYTDGKKGGRPSGKKKEETKPNNNEVDEKNKPVVLETSLKNKPVVKKDIEKIKPNVDVNVDVDVNEEVEVDVNVNENVDVDDKKKSEQENTSSLHGPQEQNPISKPKPFDPFCGHLFSDDVQKKLLKWLDYKKERKESYKPTGLNSFVMQTEKYLNLYGEKAVLELFEECMSNGWKGVIWDRLKNNFTGKTTKNSNVFLNIGVEEGLF